jgi:photosystem II PsbM protein
LKTSNPEYTNAATAGGILGWYSGRISDNFQTSEKKVRDAMEVNNLGLIATALFVIVPTVFLIILYVQTESQKGSG